MGAFQPWERPDLKFEEKGDGSGLFISILIIGTDLPGAKESIAG